MCMCGVRVCMYVYYVCVCMCVYVYKEFVTTCTGVDKEAHADVHASYVTELYTATNY